MTLGFEDLDIFFNVDEFAETVLKGPVGLEVEIHPIFDNATTMIDETYAEVNILQPKLTVKTSDLIDVREGHRFVVGGREYTAQEPVHNGTGISTVRLMKKR